MPIIILLLAIIAVALVLGPLGGWIIALGAGLVSALFGLGLLALPVLAAAGTGLLALAWCIYWCFDREGAMASYRNSPDPRRRR